MAVHLNIDIVTGLLLAASPWIFGFANQVYLPHLILGLFETITSLTTERHAPEEYVHNPGGVNQTDTNNEIAKSKIH